MLSFVLQGVFKENETRSDKAVFRFFSRSFVTVPSGPGMVITNDLLTISNASIAQSKAFKVAAPTPSSSPASSTQSVPGAQSSSIQSPEQLQMIERFMADSKMNAAYSLQCLQANDWDYNKAGLIFTDLKNQGRIPPEAFL
ncbi:nuclear RNA export factor 1 [Biomphalaria glabrata]|nr:nuclear RNA export factor 1 [Biomphalaria glabrata]